MKHRTLFYLLMFFSGTVIGSLVSGAVAGVDALRWLSYGIAFGLKEPVRLELGVLSLTFGCSLNLTVSCIIFILLAMFIGGKAVYGRK